VAVTFTTNLGKFTNSAISIIANTNASGVATAVVYSGGSVGTAQISATANEVTSNVFVNFTGSESTSSIVLIAEPPTISAESLSPSKISATLYDANGKTVASSVKVSFETTLGYFSNGLQAMTAYTDSKGLATVNLYSSGVVGTAQVSASSNGITSHANVGFTGAGPTADIVLSANPISIPSDKTSSSTITATLYDKDGLKVTSGVSVAFTTTLGIFSNTQKSISAYTNANGIATAYVYSGSFVGLAQVSASSNGVTRNVYVNFTGPGPAATLYLEASPTWVPADGYSRRVISAVITDSAGNPVAAGTTVTFMTTLGVFSNGKTTLTTVTPDATGIVKVSLTSGQTVGTATVTCNSGDATGTITISMIKLEYETEPNNDMAHADGICFNNVFLSQLSSPYEEDWYTFTISQPSRITINFITTAIPAIATQCDKGISTMGTYRVDIRDVDNNVLMSYQNVDCSLNNGTWETGVVPIGTYYIVVFCPRTPDNSHYLSTPYYLAVFDNFYFPCGDSDKLVNSASLSLKNSAYHLNVPIVDMDPYFWVDFLYDSAQATSLMFKMVNSGGLSLDDYKSCNLSTLSLVDGNYILHVPAMIFDGVSYRVDLTYVPTTDGLVWFMLSGAWLN